MKYDYTIDFKNEVKKNVDGEMLTVLQFYEKSKPTLGNGKEIIEYAYIKPCCPDIIYKTEDGDMNRLNKNLLNEFVFNIYNKINNEVVHQDIINKSKSSKPYYEIKILGKTIPLAIFLLINRTSSKKAFNIMELDYQFKDKKDPEAKVVMNFKDPEGNRQYLCLYPKDQMQWNYTNGLNQFKLKDEVFEPTIDGLIAAYTIIIDKRMGKGILKKFLEIENKFIDGSTKKILEDAGNSTDLAGVLSNEMVDLLGQRSAKSQYDLDNFRLRMSETITSVAYKQMHLAMGKFKSLQHLSKEKIVMTGDYIIKNLMDAGILQQTKTLNPVEEMMLSLKVTKTGIGNVRKQDVSLNRRDINPSYFGVMAPTATNEYGGIGINQTLTNGAMIDDRFGNISKKPFNNDGNPFENLSPIESLSPFFEYDDTTRRVMGNQQTAQFIQLEKPDVPLVQTGFESYVPHLVSDRFVKKAKEDGKILDITDDYIKVKYISGATETISIKPVKSRTKRGIYIATNYNSMINKDQTVKAGQALASSDSLKSGKLAIGRNLVVAEMGYMGMNYEDGWVVSDTLDTKFKNKILQKIIIAVPVGSKISKFNLEEGAKTGTGDVLLQWTTSEEFIEEDDDGDDDYESVFVGLETTGLNNISRSPGGVIKEIVVKINNKNVPKQIIALHKKLTEQMQLKMHACKISTDKMPKEEQDQAYTDCIGHLENIETLTIGGA